MPHRNLALIGASTLPLALATAGMLMGLVGGQYWWERRKRFELRRALDRRRPDSSAEPLANALATVSSGAGRDSLPEAGRLGEQSSESFPAFGTFCLHRAGRYGVALLFVGVALWIRWLLEPSLQGRMPYGFFLLAAVATALVAGIWETLLALAVGFLVADWYFVDPPGFQISGAHGWWGALLYLLTGCGVLWFMRSEHAAWLRTLEKDVAYLDRLKELDRERAGSRRQADCELLASIVDTAQDAILSVTSQGRIASWNAAAERLLRYPAGEAVGEPLALITPPDRRLDQERLLQRVSRGEPTEEWRTLLCSKGGDSVAVSVVFSPVTDDSGAVVGVSLIARSQPSPG